MTYTAYVRITVKEAFSYEFVSLDEATIGNERTMTDSVKVGDTFEGYVDPAQITSRAKSIRVLEVELSDLYGNETSISQASILPRSKVKVERINCSMSIKELLVAL